jgi:hypothetical protein
MTDGPNTAFRIRHRETGCWLLIEHDHDLYLGPANGQHATRFRTADDARRMAMHYGLTSAKFQIIKNEPLAPSSAPF